MRTLIFLTALLTAPLARAETLADLAWLKGCWRTYGEGPEITEVWSTPPMPALLGYSYTTGEGEVQAWEQTRIEMIDGMPTFIAMPNGGAPVHFRMLPDSELIYTDDPPATMAVFVNPSHDFPQRVWYIRRRDRMTAAISASDGSNRMTFEYRRISCARALRP